ncbi:two-component system, NtrC family, response regulator AtoC [Mariprofundus micogutta]|uniref:Two-component system, NtrC family, response regulator AtoC n=1 Tax=Mariprofundus micogutta TaxID=1921010 RepID=A0A1L8CM78_9PROT|nr:sigma-54 dependent transcriptional regulator [Mariprofundus micogutta]GAV20013.1 two-component system, NtrC family, response regulator AtoC [Mariprofundus micogutta]
MSLSKIVLIGFPQHEDAELRVQLGKLLPDTFIESPPAETFDLQCSNDTLIFIWDSVTSPSIVRRLFDHNPQANIVVLSHNGQSERAADLMHLGAIDYRILPVPDDVLEIYIRKSGHQSALAQQASEQQSSAKNKQDVFVTEDIETRRLLDRVALIAPSCASVLVIGESGTGKERLSRYVHACSNRNDQNFIAINCAAIPEGVLEAELFGHEKGAFTGATAARPGKFELAHEGTLLLDEITEMPIHLQAKLLRVLQEGEVDRLGGRKPVKIDVRVIATSNRDITKAVQNGEFRQDLYYRLNVVTIQLPPLRDRRGDILPLAMHFLERFSQMYKRPAPQLSEQAIQHLSTHPWPGNARELENCMHRAFLMAMDSRIDVEHLALDFVPDNFNNEENNSSDAVQAGVSIRDMERALIEKTLVHVQGNRTEAAELLGISIRTLRNKLHGYESGMSLAG